MYNDLFHIGKITIHGYGTMIAIGVLAAIGVAFRKIIIHYCGNNEWRME